MSNAHFTRSDVQAAIAFLCTYWARCYDFTI